MKQEFGGVVKREIEQGNINDSGQIAMKLMGAIACQRLGGK